MWGLPTCPWGTSVGLSCIISLLFLLWCVWGLPTCSWAMSVGLSFLTLYPLCNMIMAALFMMSLLLCAIDVISWLDICEVYRPAPGVRRWVSHASSHCCFVLMCVGSADLLLSSVGGSLISHNFFFCVIWYWLLSYDVYTIFDVCAIVVLSWLDKCEVYRPAPGVHRWVSHASSHFCFCCDACGVYRPAPELCRCISHFFTFLPFVWYDYGYYLMMFILFWCVCNRCIFITQLVCIILLYLRIFFIFYFYFFYSMSVHLRYIFLKVIYKWFLYIYSFVKRTEGSCDPQCAI